MSRVTQLSGFQPSSEPCGLALPLPPTGRHRAVQTNLTQSARRRYLAFLKQVHSPPCALRGCGSFGVRRAGASSEVQRVQLLRVKVSQE